MAVTLNVCNSLMIIIISAKMKRDDIVVFVPPNTYIQYILCIVMSVLINFIYLGDNYVLIWY